MQTDHERVALILFLLTFFLIYGGLHFYMLIKVKNSFLPGAKSTLCLILFMVIMVFAPVVIHILERSGYESLARLFSYVGYSWMGIVFLFFSLAVLFDVYRFSVYATGFVLNRDFSFVMPSALHSCVIPLVFAILVSAYGYFEAQNIYTERVVITTSKIPKEIGKLKIVQISDVHLGLIIREKRLREILRKIKAENPDILVSTGDLIDGQINNLGHFSEMLKEINPRYGKFAVTGNHEFYAGLDEALDFTAKSGFKVLRGEGLTISGLINIIGVDDPAEKIYGISKNITEKEILSVFPKDKFTLLLKHQPVVDTKLLGLFDLQLSGHTHKGRIFPFTLITWLRYPFNSGYFNLSNNTHLYVSRGAGTWGPPIRFLAPPEITVIELVHENNQK